MITIIIFFFDQGKCLGTFWIRVCACESAKAREIKPERDKLEMILNVEKDPAMQQAGIKAF